MDFSISMQIGLETISQLKRRWPTVRVLVLTFRRDEQLIDAALRSGADAYVLKNDSRTDLFTAIERISAGKRYLSPSVDGPVAEGGRKSGDAKPRRKVTAAGMLTEREREVMTMIAKGHRTREIAQFLSLSHKTVEKHRTTLMRKLGLRSATAVAAYAIAHGYVQL
jgi:DNA-binding NarL/FixJ family response regulator